MSSNIVPGPQIADERERERVRLAQPLAISDDIIAVGRTFKGSKQRCEWHVCFGPYGREHVVEVTISKRSGKRSVSFDGQAIHTTYISPKGAFNFGFSLEGRVLSLTSRAGSTDAAAVELSVDWVRWQLMTRKDELSMSAMTELEMALQRRISDEKRSSQPAQTRRHRQSRVSQSDSATTATEVMTETPGDIATKHPDETLGDFYTRREQGLTYEEYRAGEEYQKAARLRQQERDAIQSSPKTPWKQSTAAGTPGDVATRHPDETYGEFYTRQDQGLTYEESQVFERSAQPRVSQKADVRGCGPLIFCCFIGIIILGSIWVSERWMPEADDKAQKTWVEGDCQVVKVRSTGFATKNSYKVKIWVERLNQRVGDTVVDVNLDIGEARKYPHMWDSEVDMKRSQALRFRDNYPVGRNVTCFWNPSKPRRIAMNNHGGDWVLVWAGTALLSFVGLCIILLYLAISCCRVLDVPRRDIELGSI